MSNSADLSTLFFHLIIFLNDIIDKIVRTKKKAIIEDLALNKNTI